MIAGPLECEGPLPRESGPSIVVTAAPTHEAATFT
jgi:hypothetical protein